MSKATKPRKTRKKGEPKIDPHHDIGGYGPPFMHGPPGSPNKRRCGPMQHPMPGHMMHDMCPPPNFPPHGDPNFPPMFDQQCPPHMQMRGPMQGGPMQGGPMQPNPFMHNPRMPMQCGPPGPGMPHGHCMPHGGGGGGKIYPPSQCTVYNAANPNAPPIYPCGTCHKEVHESEQAILCESGCNFWYHRLCTGLSDTAFTLMQNEVYAEWVCENCLRTKMVPLVKLKP